MESNGRAAERVGRPFPRAGARARDGVCARPGRPTGSKYTMYVIVQSGPSGQLEKKLKLKIIDASRGDRRPNWNVFRRGGGGSPTHRRDRDRKGFVLQRCHDHGAGHD